MMKNGLIPVKDGSLRRGDGYQPFEYATIILSGKTGLQAIKKQCEILKKYCEIGLSGSLHIHIGGSSRTKEYVNSLYSLMYSLQDEVYSMFPEYYKHTSKFKESHTDYCNPLNKLSLSKNNIEGNFNVIANEICGIDGWKFSGFGKDHPNDPGGSRKWEVKSRYRLLNMTPILFGGSGTAEFRIHARKNATTSYLMGYQSYQSTGNMNYCVWGSTTLNLLANETIDIRLTTSFSANIVGSSTANENFVEIKRIGN